MQTDHRTESLLLRIVSLLGECEILAAEKGADELLKGKPLDHLLSECVLAIREKLPESILNGLKSVGTLAPETGNVRVFHDNDRRSDYETSQELKEELIRLGVIYDRRHGRGLYQPWPKPVNDAGELKRRVDEMESSLSYLRGVIAAKFPLAEPKS